jgi:hypothetical protein
VVRRALARRGGAEYSPWAVASRHLGQVQAFLGSSSSTSDCAEAWAAFVQKEVSGQQAPSVIAVAQQVLHFTVYLSARGLCGICCTETLISTMVIFGPQVLPRPLAAVTGGGSNSSFVVGADDSTALRLIRPAILRLAGALWQAILGSGWQAGRRRSWQHHSFSMASPAASKQQ